MSQSKFRSSLSDLHPHSSSWSLLYVPSKVVLVPLHSPLKPVSHTVLSTCPVERLLAAPSTPGTPLSSSLYHFSRANPIRLPPLAHRFMVLPLLFSASVRPSPPRSREVLSPSTPALDGQPCLPAAQVRIPCRTEMPPWVCSLPPPPESASRCRPARPYTGPSSASLLSPWRLQSHQGQGCVVTTFPAIHQSCAW